MMEDYKKIIAELEAFMKDVKFYYEHAYTDRGQDTSGARERISRQSQKIKRYLKGVGVATSVSGRAAPVAGGFPFHYDLIEDMFQNERSPYAVEPKTVLDVINKAIGVYEELSLGTDVLSTPLEKKVKEGFFVDGKYYEAQKFVRELFNGAKKSIIIIDNYIDASVIDLLGGKLPDIKVEIITSKVPPEAVAVGKAYSKQFGKLSIRRSDAFHDRFIVIDDEDFYHLGASIKDLGSRTFMFSRMEDKEMIKLLIDKFRHEWAKGIDVI